MAEVESWEMQWQVVPNIEKDSCLLSLCLHTFFYLTSKGHLKCAYSEVSPAVLLSNNRAQDRLYSPEKNGLTAK